MSKNLARTWRMTLAVSAALALLPAAGARAGGMQAGGPEAGAAEDADCSGNTLQMVRCGNRIFDRADRELNLIWDEKIAVLEREDRTLDDQREPRADIARRAQKAWAAFRDAECAAQADEEARGGSMYPLIYIGCRTEMTREHILQLRPMVVER
jgi:uncharacterized protein YecT (DUF1311 family)